MITKIIIPDLIDKKVSNSGKSYLSIKGKDGEWYQVWDASLFNNLLEGKAVKVKINQVTDSSNRDYNNIIGFSGQVKTGEIKATEKEQKATYSEKEKGIERGVCFNKACDIVIALFQKGEVKKSGIFAEIKKTHIELLKIIEKK